MELDARVDKVEADLASIRDSISRIKYLAYGAVGFFVLSEIGFLEALKLA